PVIPSFRTRVKSQCGTKIRATNNECSGCVSPVILSFGSSALSQRGTRIRSTNNEYSGCVSPVILSFGASALSDRRTRIGAMNNYTYRAEWWFEGIEYVGRCLEFPG